MKIQNAFVLSVLLVLCAVITIVLYFRLNYGAIHSSDSAQHRTPEINKGFDIKHSRSESEKVSAIKSTNDYPVPVRNATKEPVTMQFLSSLAAKMKEVGEVGKTENGTYRLSINGRQIFEGQRIENGRSISNNGNIAISAVLGTNTPWDRTESSGVVGNTKPEYSVNEVWVVEASGRKQRVSDTNVNADRPLISPDGNMVAYSGIVISSNGQPSQQSLFVYNMKSGKTRLFSSKETLPNYSVGAAEWSENGKELRVLENHGETAGNLTMKIICFD